MTAKKKISIICNNDKLWSLYAMNQFYELINKNNYEIKGFWICDEKFGAKNKNALVWYYKIFGLKVFMLLGVFFVFFKMTSIYHSIFNNYSVSFEKLCKKNKVNFFYTKSPNSHKLYDWTVKNEIDITIIMVGHILKKKNYLCLQNRYNQ